MKRNISSIQSKYDSDCEDDYDAELCAISIPLIRKCDMNSINNTTDTNFSTYSSANVSDLTTTTTEVTYNIDDDSTCSQFFNDESDSSLNHIHNDIDSSHLVNGFDLLDKALIEPVYKRARSNAFDNSHYGQHDSHTCFDPFTFNHNNENNDMIISCDKQSQQLNQCYSPVFDNNSGGIFTQHKSSPQHNGTSTLDMNVNLKVNLVTPPPLEKKRKSNFCSIADGGYKNTIEFPTIFRNPDIKPRMAAAIQSALNELGANRENEAAKVTSPTRFIQRSALSPSSPVFSSPFSRFPGYTSPGTGVRMMSPYQSPSPSNYFVNNFKGNPQKLVSSPTFRTSCPFLGGPTSSPIRGSISAKMILSQNIVRKVHTDIEALGSSKTTKQYQKKKVVNLKSKAKQILKPKTTRGSIKGDKLKEQIFDDPFSREMAANMEGIDCIDGEVNLEPFDEDFISEVHISDNCGLFPNVIETDSSFKVVSEEDWSFFTEFNVDETISMLCDN
jgi:hypothetical protein